ncbi:MAG: TIGR03087 family PEP-CTERM/XrtA system glycosyltransferase [Burkholderiaceae bacterium]|nr:TIGR03087 family PEP-CTERM/XrtA system glycosyltransferase [Burkholderiaceae bacterium]
MRCNLLMLVHRIPYPPNKGDKIRSYHLLRHLAAQHAVHLGAFVDDPQDWEHRAALQGLCASLELVALRPLARRVRSLWGFATGEALSLPYYRVPELQRWVDETILRQRITHVVVFSSTMAQYVQGSRYAGLRRVADLCDVDSDKWRQYAEGHRGPARWIYAREANRLLAFERAIAREFDATLFVTQAEADLFRSLAPESAPRIGHFDNGVDTEYFDPQIGFASPYSKADATGLAQPAVGSAPIVVFTGAMDYWANVDAVEWFVEQVWPHVRACRPGARFFIVGSNPTPAVCALEAHDGVQVTGRVPDVRPYLAHADVAVAPLRIARGTQNKVLEALAMAKPVVCTSAAASGLNLPMDNGFRVHDDGKAFAEAVVALAAAGENTNGRTHVTESFGWRANLLRVDRVLASEAAA